MLAAEVESRRALEAEERGAWRALETGEDAVYLRLLRLSDPDSRRGGACLTCSNRAATGRVETCGHLALCWVCGAKGGPCPACGAKGEVIYSCGGPVCQGRGKDQVCPLCTDVVLHGGYGDWAYYAWRAKLFMRFEPTRGMAGLLGRLVCAGSAEEACGELLGFIGRRGQDFFFTRRQAEVLGRAVGVWVCEPERDAVSVAGGGWRMVAGSGMFARRGLLTRSGARRWDLAMQRLILARCAWPWGMREGVFDKGVLGELVRHTTYALAGPYPGGAAAADRAMSVGMMVLTGLL